MSQFEDKWSAQNEFPKNGHWVSMCTKFYVMRLNWNQLTWYSLIMHLAPWNGQAKIKICIIIGKIDEHFKWTGN